ncbi:MAG TPA: hypothetical protein VMU67_02810 [Steroidobacteraceae bacterium]|nr:hypothetical protein [Steroidobacteraceae bacterium]
MAAVLAIGVIGMPAAMAQSSGSQDQQTAPGGQGQAGATSPAIQAGPVTLDFGGFTELATIWRNRTEFADVGSVSYGSLPFPTASNYYVSEFRESARQSRFSLLAKGEHFLGLTPEAYFEMDFLGAAPTANSRESNSYNPRMRVFYADFLTDGGLYFLAGQSWSLATLYKQGLQARNEDVPLTIDAQYVSGFNWTRNPQVRIVQEFSKTFSLGLSLESPQTVVNASNTVPSALASSAYPAGLLYSTTPSSAGGLLDNATSYTYDIAPDVVLKAALDPGWGHYELYGLGRWFRTAIPGASASENTVTGGGIGGGAILPLIPHVLSVQVSGLYGKGIGRYSSSQLADVTLQPNGDFSPIKEYDVLLGLMYNPVPQLQIYGYFGRDKASADYFDATITAAGVVDGPYAYGYGNPLYNNSGCYTLGGKCQGNVAQSDEVSAGVWWKYYEGRLGNLQLGLQLAYNQDDLFNGVGGSPRTGVSEGMVSFRYYPYQH